MVSTQDGPGIELAVHHTRTLAAGARAVHALVIVSAAPVAAAAEVLLLDCSSTMNFPRSKMLTARAAAIAAVEALADGVLFAVVRGTSRARLIYPQRPELAVADARTRANAIEALSAVQPGGGTSVGAWLAAARDLFGTHPEAAGHALLITDGRDQPESLEQVLESCAGRFGCDAFGVGDDWDPAQLRRITSVLGGEAYAVADEARLAGHFRVTAAQPQPALTLRIGTMPHTRLRFIRQIAPDRHDLTNRCRGVGPRQVELAIGALAGEYHLCIELTAQKRVAFDREESVGWVEVVRADSQADSQVDAEEGHPMRRLAARWTRNPPPQTVIPPLKVRRPDRRTDLIAATVRGREAHAAHDVAAAEKEWGRAVAVAHELGDTAMLARLAGLVDIEDAAAGEVTLRPELDRDAILSALIGAPTSGPAVPVPAGDPVTCPTCDWRSPAGARFCEACRQPLWQRL